MFLHLLQKASTGLEVHSSEAQAVLSLSLQNNKIPTLIPPTFYYNPYNITSEAPNLQEMNDGFRGRRRMRGDSSEDMHQRYQDANNHGNLDDSPNSRTDILFTAPIGQIDDYDGQMDGSSESPAKRSRRQDQRSRGDPPSLPSINSNGSSKSPEASPTQPSLPNSPFVFFFRIERENLLEQAKNGTTQFQNTQQVVQTIEKKWESLPIEDRRIYEQLAAKDEERYKREMEEYRMKQEQLHDHPQRLSNQGEHMTANNLQNMNFVGGYAGNLATAPSALPHIDPRMQQQVNVIAGLRPPFPPVAAPPIANPATNVAPGHHHPQQHHFMPPLLPTSLGASMYASSNAITPPQNAVGVGGQQLPPHLPLHQYSPSNPAPPALTASSSSWGSIQLPPSESMPLPAGMEIELGGRKYRVGYLCQVMTREEAQKYVKPYTAAQNEKSETHQDQPPPSSS